MPKVIWKDTVLAEADKDQCPVVEGNYYFPPAAVNPEYFKPSSTHTNCFWKGQASYYNLEMGGETLKDAAWYYPEPKEKAMNIKDHVAFYKGKVTIQD